MQIVPVKLPAVIFDAGQGADIPLRNVPKTLFGRLVHVAGFLFENRLTPTHTTAPDVVGTNNLVKSMTINDGRRNWYRGSFRHLRALEYLWNGGRLLNADPDTDTASATARYFRRTFFFGPPRMVGGLLKCGTDFVLPAALLENGVIHVDFGTLADLSADATAATGSVTVYALCVLLDEVRIPPATQVDYVSVSAKDNAIQGRCLYTHVALLNSNNVDAIAAGDFGNVKVDAGYGDVVPNIPVQALTQSFLLGYGAGHLTSLSGEPIAASDDNEKSVNLATPTALKGAERTVQPIVFPVDNGKLSKMMRVDSSLRIVWDGAQATADILVARVLEQEAPQTAALIADALGTLKRSRKSLRIKTDSKAKYVGPYEVFMPWKVAV